MMRRALILFDYSRTVLVLINYDEESIGTIRL
jgi:hypothetical protein